VGRTGDSSGDSTGDSSGGAEPATVLEGALAIVDLASEGIVAVVPGLDGAPITTLGAEFLPDGTVMIVHAFDQTVLRVELAGTPLVLPVGQVPEMFGLSTDGTRLTGTDAFGGVVLDLATGVESRLDPSLVDGELAFGGAALLTRTELRVQKVALADVVTAAVRVLLVADDGSGASRVLFRTTDDRGSIGVFTISPNDQYIAVEVTPSVADAVADGRLVNGRPTSVTTIVIDLDSGAVVRTLEGFSPIW